MENLIKSTNWQDLIVHQQHLATTSIQQLFENDPQRFKHFSLNAAGLFVDYSKNLCTAETLSLLIALAEACQLREWIEKLFTGQTINNTENSAVTHTALRDPQPTADIAAELNKMKIWSDLLRENKCQGATHKPITDIVNIGIGGSDLGVRMAIEALKPYVTSHLNFHFVSNIDGSQIFETLSHLHPETTLFIISSKSFTTLETLCNANTAKEWLINALGSVAAIKPHLLAITAQADRAVAFGIDPNQILSIDEGVGGRYSLWSAMGFPLAIAIGMSRFNELLVGAHAMDLHFRQNDFAKNLPVILALLDVWYINFFDAKSRVVLTYDHYLRLLPSYLQQLIMESNGKRVQRNGESVNYATAPIIWGGVGADCQHSYFQLLFQGTQLIPADFIIPVNTHNAINQHHAILFANCMAQSQVLMRGKSAITIKAELEAQGLSNDLTTELAMHKTIIGNQPSNTLLMPKLTPKTLGALLALYEHRTFVQGVIWNINSFDQWGVELGKKTAGHLLNNLVNKAAQLNQLDSSTQGLINYFHKHLGKPTKRIKLKP